MESHPTIIDISTWVNEAPVERRDFRQAVHIILTAIAHEPRLRAHMVMKGGILLALRYHSKRFTQDIDFSTDLVLADLPPGEVVDLLDGSLPEAIDQLGYELDCRVQSWEVRPNKAGAKYPGILMGIGYARRGTPKHKRLQQKQSPDKATIDFSLNEPILETEVLELDADGTILTYAFSDLFAEKLRALLQQVHRREKQPLRKPRRQDIYDLHLLLGIHAPDETEKAAILHSLRTKAAAREITVTPDSMADEAIKELSRKDYPTLRDEIEGELPDFDTSYARVESFYRSLPWA